REHHAGVLDADVVGRQAAGALLPRLVVQRQIRADHLPALSAVGGLMHVLAADVDLVVVVRRNRQRHRPVEPVLQIGGNAVGLIRPDLDVAGLPPPLVVAHDDAADAAGAGGAGPDDV